MTLSVCDPVRHGTLLKCGSMFLFGSVLSCTLQARSMALIQPGIQWVLFQSYPLTCSHCLIQRAFLINTVHMHSIIRIQKTPASQPGTRIRTAITHDCTSSRSYSLIISFLYCFRLIWFLSLSEKSPDYKKVRTTEILFGIIMETIRAICFHQSVVPYGRNPDDQREENIL